MIRFKPVAILALLLTLVIAVGYSFHNPAPAYASSETAATHGEAGAEGAEGASHGVSSAKIWDLVWRTLNFAVLFIVLFIVLKKPLSQALGGRRENIANTLADLEQKKSEAEAKFKELEIKLGDLKTERDQILAEYIKSGEAEREKIISGAQEMAERIRQQADIAIQQEIKKAKDELTREIAELSASMAEDLVKKSINEEDQQRLVAEYLNKVVQN